MYGTKVTRSPSYYLLFLPSQLFLFGRTFPFCCQQSASGRAYRECLIFQVRNIISVLKFSRDFVLQNLGILCNPNEKQVHIAFYSSFFRKICVGRFGEPASTHSVWFEYLYDNLIFPSVIFQKKNAAFGL